MLPSAVTLGNLTCGFLSIVSASAGNFKGAAWLIFLSMVFDIMDGRVARLTKTTSRFGEELDSLADLVSFGAAPAFLFYGFFLKAEFGRVGLVLSCIFVLCGALRLARFNVTEGSDNFQGLPIPGGAALLASTVIHGHVFQPWAGTRIFPVILALSAVLMISNFEYPAFKKKGAQGNIYKKLLLALILLGVILIVHEILILAVSFFYAFLGPLGWMWEVTMRTWAVGVVEEKIRNRRLKKSMD
jgi:CDP-diacylglycerol--serine O-phosphatidyltransferase